MALVRLVGSVLVLFLVLLSVCAAGMTAPNRQDSPPPPLRGIVRDASGKPIPGVALFLPGWSSNGPSGRSSNQPDASNHIVVAQADGTFVWEKPYRTFPPEYSPPPVSVLSQDFLYWTPIPPVDPIQNRIYTSPPLRRFRDRLQSAQVKWEHTPDGIRLVVEPPPFVSVRMTVHKPDGSPLANSSVQVWYLLPHPEAGSVGMFGWGTPDRVFSGGKTDAEGSVVLRLFPGRENLYVVVPGVGYAPTGSFNVPPGQDTTVELPRLVPFGAISGVVARELLKTGQVVFLSHPSSANRLATWIDRYAEVDAEGRFVLQDVPPGNHGVALLDPEEREKWDRSRTRVWRAAYVAPGQRTDGLVLTPPSPQDTPIRPYKRLEPKILEGRVRDTAGRPVADAAVWVVYQGNSADRVWQTTTDSAGAYRIEGLPAYSLYVRNTGYCMLVARKQDRPLAFGHAILMADRTTAPDMILPTTGATLAVQVLDRDGHPQSNITVEARPRIAGNYLSYSKDMRRDDLAKTALLHPVISPRVLTDANGIARFRHLSPGYYDLMAVDVNAEKAFPNTPEVTSADRLQQYRLLNYGKYTPEMAIVQDVPVALSKPNAFTLRLQDIKGILHFRFRTPPGLTIYNDMHHYLAAASSPASERVEFFWTQLLKPFDATNSVEGFRTEDFRLGQGIWRFTSRVRSDYGYTPAYQEPLPSVQTVVASSLYRERTDLIELETLPVHSARLTVQLVDEDGKPVQGAVYLSNHELSFLESVEQRVGVTDKQGRITLYNLVPGPTWIRADALGEPPLPDLSEPKGDSLPSIVELKGRQRWPTIQVTTHSDSETRITLRSRRMGWVRGKIHNDVLGNLMSNAWDKQERWGTRWRIDRKTGDYVFGPFEPGSLRLTYFGFTRMAEKTVRIRPGAVTIWDITPDIEETRVMRDRAEADRVYYNLTGAVFLPDGRTPASGACVLFFYSLGDSTYARTYLADANGAFFPYGYSLWEESEANLANYPPYTPLSKSLKKRLAVALLPGAHGAAIQEVPEGGKGAPLRFVLPPASSAQGKVTVGGKSFGGWCPGVIRILAQYQGRAPLNSVFSVKATAESDGSFMLAGLTPGKYVIQAALDSIWYSPPRSVTVEADKPIPSLTLEIPEPGQPSVISLGANYSGTQASLVTPLPEGPFAVYCRPTFYVADGAGRLRLEGLPAGRHRLRLPDQRIITADIQPFPAP